MDCFVDVSGARPNHGEGCDSYSLLGPENGCTGLCRTGITIYYETEYLPARTHPFQEGFYVIEGTGFARVGQREFPLHPGVSFLAPADTPHTVRCVGKPIRLFWFHA